MSGKAHHFFRLAVSGDGFEELPLVSNLVVKRDLVPSIPLSHGSRKDVLLLDNAGHATLPLCFMASRMALNA